MTPHVDNIPETIRALPDWVTWRTEPRPDGKAAKVPYTPGTDRRAKANDPATWGTFNAAVADYGDGAHRDGIGFELQGSGLTFVDVDHCITDAGELLPWAAEIVADLDSYTERSPGGRGLHVLARGSLPPGGNKSGDIEMYDAGRYATITGDLWDGRDTIEDRQAEITALHRRIFGASKQSATPPPAPPPVNLDDAALIDKAHNAADGAKFARLWAGDISGYHNDDSAADQALCNLLAFWGGDPQRVDRLFRLSGLYRAKWERADYRERTIRKAIMDTSQRYEAGQTVTTPAPAEEPPEAPPERAHLSDIGNGQRLAARHGAKLRYCHPWGKWLTWSGKRWRLDDTAATTRAAKDTVATIYAEASRAADEDIRKRIAKHAMASESAHKLRAMLEMASSEPGIPVLPDQLDRDPWQLNVYNGTVNLRTGALEPHRADHLITKLAPVSYDPDADCPLWLSFLDRVMDGDRDLIGFLQRAVGYSLTADTGEQCFFILHGSGANGKTTFLQAISALLGDYALQTPTDTLLIRRGGGIPNDLARLRGARLVTAIEADEGRRLAEALVKQVTGGDKVTARFLHAEFFEFVPEFKLWLGTNHKPAIRGTDWAIWRRIRLVPFNVTIPPEEQDHQLGQRLLAELDGILAWAVQGCLDWQREGLNPPPAVVNATAAYRDESDPLGTFLEDCCILDDNARAQAGPLYDTYRQWCKSNGEDAVTSRRFSRQLDERGFDKVTERHRYYLGIGLLIHSGGGDAPA